MKYDGLYRSLDEMEDEIISMSDVIAEYRELPYEEFKSAELLCRWLEKEGFAVERGIAGLPTAFRAVYQRGEGGISLGLLCEYDALPNGHSCGHHMQGPAILAAAKALKESDIAVPFRLVVYGTPAEEVVSGKVNMIKAGCFKDIDFALMTHAHPETSVAEASLNGVDLDVVFTGVHAHDTAMPWANRSGFDAMLQAIQGVEYLRGHVHDMTRIFYLVRDGIGIEGNTDPSRAEIRFGIRTPDTRLLPGLEKRVRDIIQGAALMSGVHAEVEKTLEFLGILPNKALAGEMLKIAEEVGADNIIEKREFTGGSNDFGDVTQRMPGAQIYICMSRAFHPMHSEAMLEEMLSDYGKRQIIKASKVVAGTGVRLITDPSFAEEVRKEFEQRRVI